MLTKNTLKNWLIASSPKKSKETIKLWAKHHLQALVLILLPVGVGHFALCLVKPWVPPRRLSAAGHRRPTTPTHLENGLPHDIALLAGSAPRLVNSTTQSVT